MPRLNQEQLKIAKEKARKLDVEVKPAKNPKKKLDVFKDGKKVASIGASAYSDFIQSKDPEMRKRYKQRHERFRKKKGTPSFYADQILW